MGWVSFWLVVLILLLYTLYILMFFFLLLFVLCSGIVYIYQDCFLLYPYTAMTCHSGDSFDYEDI